MSKLRVYSAPAAAGSQRAVAILEVNFYDLDVTPRKMHDPHEKSTRAHPPAPAPAPRRLYLDNAATSFPKPRAVLDAMVRYANELGASAGRGAYHEAVESGKLIETCRRRLNQLFNGAGPSQFVFTLNCTEALNLAIKGLIDPQQKGHAICTAIDHNSILRPLTALLERGWIDSQTRMPVDAKTGLVDPD